jgi:hypothetical protein
MSEERRTTDDGSGAPANATCQCGYDVEAGWVARKPRYTMLDGFFVLFGISATPYAIEFTCRKCGDIIAVEDDPHVLGKFV